MTVCLWLHTFGYTGQFDTCCKGGLVPSRIGGQGKFHLHCDTLGRRAHQNMRETQTPTTKTTESAVAPKRSYAEELMAEDPAIATLVVEANRLDCALYRNAHKRFVSDVRRMEEATGLVFLDPRAKQESSWCERLSE